MAANNRSLSFEMFVNHMTLNIVVESVVNPNHYSYNINQREILTADNTYLSTDKTKQIY